MTPAPQTADAAALRSANTPPASGVLHGALALLSTQPFSWAAALLSVVLLPRYLGAHGLGEYTAATTVANLTAGVTSLGLPSFFVRQIAQSARAPRSYLGAGVVVVAALSALAAILLSLVLPRVGLPVRSNLLSIVLAGMVVGSLQNLLLAVLMGQERHGAYAWLNAGASIATTLAGIAVLAAGGGILLFAASGAVTSALTLLIFWRASGLRLNRAAFSPSLWTAVGRGGFPFLGWNLALNVYTQINQVMLAVMARAAEVGWYAAAYRIIAIPVFIPTLIITPLLPALSRCADDQHLFGRLLRGSFLAALVLTVPCAAMIIGLAPTVPGLLHWPAEFEHSVPLMMILALHEPLVAVDMVLATGLQALKREGRWLHVGILAAFVNPTLNLILIPLTERTMHNGAAAAAAVTVGTELLMFAGALCLLPPGVFTRRIALVAGRVILAGAVMWLVVASLRESSLLAAVAAGGLTYGAMILLLRAISADELRTLTSMLTESFHRRLVGRGTSSETPV